MTRVFPSALNVTPTTRLGPYQPFSTSVARTLRVAASHSRTFPSWPPVASVSPSGLNATPLVPLAKMAVAATTG